jgi:release factor glutamine methyltransferase
MNLITARDEFRATMRGLYPQNESDFYFKMILSSLFGIDPISIALEPNLPLKSDQLKKLGSIKSDLLLEKPLQYILGEVRFRKVNLKVTPLVLIPRPETEELVGWILEDFAQQESGLSVIDFGTGSGCIALSLKKEQPNFKVNALDLNQSILDLVEGNAKQNGLEIKCILGNINTPENIKLKVDIIVSNPPYISQQEKVELKKNVLEYEPHQALFVPQEDPLIFYRNILLFAEQNLNSKGKIYFEINPLFEQEMETLIFSFDCYTITKRMDIFGKLRMLRLEKK